MRNLWRSSGILGLTVVACAAVCLPAQAGTVGPKQFFTGVINGTDGNTITPITIEMACVGPVRPGETGHPVDGQTLAVHQLFPPGAPAGSLGRTGNDSQIGVFFTAPPPDKAGIRPAAGAVVFTRYDKPKPLPTSLTLPCAGTGTVWFAPIPVVPPSRSATVPVRYVGQPWPVVTWPAPAGGRGQIWTGFDAGDREAAPGQREGVSITVNGHSWNSRVAIMRGRYLLGLSNANRKAAGVVTGDEVEVQVEVNAEPPVVAEPADFARALDADPAARAAYDRLAYSHKREHVIAIESAKSQRRANGGSRRPL